MGRRELLAFRSRATVTKQPRKSIDSPLPIFTRPLSCDDWTTVAALFGTNGACGGCWCMWWRRPRGGKLWEECKGAKNKRTFKISDQRPTLSESMRESWEEYWEEPYGA